MNVYRRFRWFKTVNKSEYRSVYIYIESLIDWNALVAEFVSSGIKHTELNMISVDVIISGIVRVCSLMFCCICWIVIFLFVFFLSGIYNAHALYEYADVRSKCLHCFQILICVCWVQMQIVRSIHYTETLCGLNEFCVFVWQKKNVFFFISLVRQVAQRNVYQTHCLLIHNVWHASLNDCLPL